jgi:hypothetical protein
MNETTPPFPPPPAFPPPPSFPSAGPARTGLLPFTLLIDEAMKLMRRHFKVMFPAVAAPLAVAAAATAVFQALMLKNITTEISPAGMPTFSLGSIVMGLLQMFILIVGMIALQKAAVEATAGRPVDMRAAWRFALRPTVLGTLILQGLAVVASVFACCVGVLYVAPLLALTGPAMADEGVVGPTALSRSATLTRYNPRGNFLETPQVKALGLMLITALISYTMSAVVTIPFQLPMYLDMFRDIAAGNEPNLAGMSQWAWLQIPAQVLNMVATIAVATYSSFAYALLFFDTRARKEGSDLAGEIHAVFGPGAPAAPESGAP